MVSYHFSLQNHPFQAVHGAFLTGYGLLLEVVRSASVVFVTHPGCRWSVDGRAGEGWLVSCWGPLGSSFFGRDVAKNRGIQGALIFDSLLSGSSRMEGSASTQIWTIFCLNACPIGQMGGTFEDELSGMIKRQQRVVTDLRWFRCVLFVMFSLDDLDNFGWSRWFRF